MKTTKTFAEEMEANLVATIKELIDEDFRNSKFKSGALAPSNKMTVYPSGKAFGKKQVKHRDAPGPSTRPKRTLEL